MKWLKRKQLEKQSESISEQLILAWEFGKMSESKSLPMTKETGQLHLMSPSPIQKDSSVTQPKIKLLRTQPTLFSMPRDWSAENSMIQLCKRIWSFGHSKLSQDLMTSQWSSWNSKEKQRSSIPKKSLQWFWSKWKKQLRHS